MSIKRFYGGQSVWKHPAIMMCFLQRGSVDDVIEELPSETRWVLIVFAELANHQKLYALIHGYLFYTDAM